MAIASATRVRNWIGLGVSAAASRIVIRLAITAFLARLLLPDDFGSAALAVSVANLLALCVGAPFEEALAQHKRIRQRHLEALLGTTLVVAVSGCLLLIPIGAAMAAWFDRADFLPIMSVLGLLLMLQAYHSVFLGIARRWRRFEAINLASFLGQLAGGAAAGLAGWADLGVWALIALPIVALAGSAATLLVTIGLKVRPRLDFALTAPLWRFGRHILASRLLGATTYLLLNLLVGQLFGLRVLGYFNMAMRIVEPIRGTAGALGHDLGYPFLKAARRDPERMREAIAAASGRTALMTAPVFMGVASVSPVLIPLLAGPAWTPAVPIAMLLALGGMFLMPMRIVSAAISAAGRPRYTVSIELAGFAALVAALTVLAGFGPVSVGLARLIADGVQTVVALQIGRTMLSSSLGRLLGGLAVPWLAALLMAGVVFGFGKAVTPLLPLWTTLALSIVIGACVYAAVLLVFDRQRLTTLLAAARGQAEGPASRGSPPD